MVRYFIYNNLQHKTNLLICIKKYMKDTNMLFILIKNTYNTPKKNKEIVSTVLVNFCCTTNRMCDNSRKSAFTQLHTIDNDILYPDDPRRPVNILYPLQEPPENAIVHQFIPSIILPYYLIPKEDMSLTTIKPDNFIPSNILELYNTTNIVTVKRPKKVLANEGIQKYQIIENTKVICDKCKNSVSITLCFSNSNSGFICVECALTEYNNVSELNDWEPNDKVINVNNIRPTYQKCDRLKHAKPFCSFIRYVHKNNNYELGRLCIFCRNVKRFEYLMKQKLNRYKNHKRLLL